MSETYKVSVGIRTGWRIGLWRIAFINLLLVSQIVAFSAVMQAQSIRKPLRVLTTQDGLPQSFISGLVQDTDGFVWVGTRNGIARYDGRQFTAFHYKQGDSTTLSSDVVISMTKDAQGRIWIEHESGEIDKLTPQNQQIERISQKPLLRQHPMRFARRGWVIDSKGCLWGTRTIEGLWCYDWANQAVHHYTRQSHGLPSDSVLGLLVSRRGTIWLMSRHELSQLNPMTGKIQSRRLPVSIDVEHLSDLSGNTVRLHERTNGEVMWADGNRLSIFSPTTSRFRQIQLPRSLGASLCWFSTGPDGQDYLTLFNQTYRYDPANGLIALGELELPSQSGESLLVDSSGLIWVGTNAAGIQQIDRSGPYFETHANKLGFQPDIFQHLFSVSLAKTFDWPTTDGGFRLASYVFRSTYDSHNRLWVGLRNRVGYYDSTQQRIVTLPLIPAQKASTDLSLGVAGLRFDPTGTLWIVDSYGHLAWFDTSHQQWVSWLSAIQLEQAVGFKVLAVDLLVDAQAIWITTRTQGLIRIDRATRRVQAITQLTPAIHFPSNLMLGMQPDPTRSNLLWIGSYAGLLVLNKTTLQGRVFTMADGLPDNTIYSVVADDAGYLWLSTNKGLCRFHPITHQVRTMQTADGLPGDEFNRFHHLRLPDGRLAFGGTEGWTIFDPGVIQNDHFQPPTALTELKINNQVELPTPGRGPLQVPINSLNALVVPYRHNTISLSFAGLQYNQPAKLQYRYQLEGYDDGWVQAGFSPLATYTQLPPGHYTLLVNATNTTGQWSRHVHRLPITIQPPWWRTNLAYLLYMLAIFALLRVYIQFRTKQDRDNQVRLIQQREAEQLRVVDEMKNRFFANITHEFRTPLTLIISPVEALINELGQSRFGDRLTLIERNAQQLLGLINQLMDLARLDAKLMTVTPVRGRPDEVIDGIVNTFAEAAVTNHIQLIYNAEETNLYWFDPNKLERVVTNLVANALKFTAGTPTNPGRITITLHAGSGLHLSVADTGIGISEDQIPHLFNRFYQVEPESDKQPHSANNSSRLQQSGTGIGLALVKELVDLQQGQIRVTSQPGQGTTFWVELPYQPVTDSQPSIPIKPPLESQPIEPTDSEPALLLLVEDNDDLAQFISQSLPSNYQVHRAVDGLDGLEQAQRLLPDLVISDVMMPRMNGYEFCQRLKTDPLTDHIPILLLTAKTTQENRMQGLRSGADEYLSKPFHLPELLLRLNNLLATQRRLRQRIQTELAAPTPVPGSPEPHPFLETMYQVLAKHIDTATFGVDDLATEANLSRMQLHRKLKALTGLSTTEFIRTYRLQQAISLLAQGISVTQTAYAVGFDNPSYFGQCFREQFGHPPSHFTPKMS